MPVRVGDKYLKGLRVEVRDLHQDAEKHLSEGRLGRG